jgi:hypothetical protein
MCCPDHVISKSDHGLAIICLILNIIIPGFGTIINAIGGSHAFEGIVYGIL